MARIAFPTENSVGTLFSSTANVLREQALALLLKSHPCESKSYVAGGFTPTSTGSNGVNFLYGSGGHVAMVNGILISFDSDQSITGLSNNSHFIYAQLSKSSSLVTDWTLVSNTTGTIPTDAVPLAHVVVTGGVAGNPQAAKMWPLCCQGSYTGDGNTPRTIFLGWRPMCVRLYTGGAQAFLWRDSDFNSGTNLYAGNTIVECGFTVGVSGLNGYNGNGGSYKYLATISGSA